MKKLVILFYVSSLVFFIGCSETKKVNDNLVTFHFPYNYDSLKAINKKDVLEITKKGDTIRVRNKDHYIKIIKNGDTIKITQTGGFITIDEGYITVIGVAKEGKGGAFISVDSTHRHFIKDLDSWTTDVKGKTVKAHGRCITLDQRKIMRISPFRQGYPVKTTLEDVQFEGIEHQFFRNRKEPTSPPSPNAM